MNERILLIEDDRELGAQIVEHLRRAGFQPTWWREGRHVEPDAELALVIIDLMLPGVYGMDILKELRLAAEIPVVVLSARNDTADKVRALKLGADDYITKPFWPEELIERLRARLRRPSLERSELIEVAGLRIDLIRREVRVDGKPVELTVVELAFLTALARRPGAAVTRGWLAEHVLDAERDGGERTLDVHASRLRKKIGAERIETVWGIGYRLAVPRKEDL